MLTATEKLKVVLNRKNMQLKDLADAADMSRQNLHSKLSKDNMSEADLRKFTEALGIEYRITLIMEDGTEI